MTTPSPPDARLHQLSLWSESDTLYAQVSGTIDAQAIRIAYWKDIVTAAVAQGHRKLLMIDRRKHQPATPGELAELAALFIDQADWFERVAVIEPTPAFVPAIEHAEIIARTLGLNVRIFPEIRDAERWLHDGSPDD